MVGIMENIYKEMRKRLALKNSQVDYNQAVDDMGNPIDRAVDLPEDNSLDSEKRLDKTRANEMNRMLSHLAVAAGPALSSFSPGTSAEQASRYKDSSNYLKNIGDIEGAAAKSLQKISNEEGLPEFIRTENSVGMEPYYQDKSSSLLKTNGTEKAAMKGVPHKVINIKSGKRTFIAVSGDNVVREIGKTEPFDMTDWVADPGVGSTMGKDIYGTKSYTQYEKSNPNIKQGINSYTGIGEKFGHIPELEAQLRMKAAEKGRRVVSESKAVLADLDASEKVLKNTKDPMAFSIGLGQALRTVEKRLSDQEQERFMGNNYRGIFQNAENYIQGKAGIIPPNIRSGVMDALKYLKAKEQAKIDANKASYSDTEGLSEQGKRSIKRTSGQGSNPEKNETEDWRKKLKESYR